MYRILIAVTDHEHGASCARGGHCDIVRQRVFDVPRLHHQLVDCLDEDVEAGGGSHCQLQVRVRRWEENAILSEGFEG